MSVGLVAVLLSAAACGSTGTTTATGPKTVAVTDSDNGKDVELNQGDTLEVTLAGNPTTGYIWEQVDPDTAVLRQAGQTEFKPDSSAIGSPGQFYLRFDAAGPGKTTLQMQYSRSFEPDTPPAQTFSLSVTVNQLVQGY